MLLTTPAITPRVPVLAGAVLKLYNAMPSNHAVGQSAFVFQPIAIGNRRTRGIIPMKRAVHIALMAAAFLLTAADLQAQKIKVIVDQDARGPATTDMQSILIFLQSDKFDVLGITTVSGDQWVKEETQRTLRERLRLTPAEFNSLVGEVRSQLDLSLAARLKDAPKSQHIGKHEAVGATSPVGRRARPLPSALDITSPTSSRLSWKANRISRPWMKPPRTLSCAPYTNIPAKW